MADATLKLERIDVLALQWKNTQWLDEKLHSKQTQYNEKLRQQVYMIQVLGQQCKTLLYGLKDEELEIRLEALEEQFKDAIVLPREKKK